ncbi:CAP domain-containing protein [Pseudalkalibacillus decolorationis]|uniref:CAP domain-containing protein n=1 Tax=Pseudalkalibacillus decolorationis TaxID=163879 RepID=UPI0021497DEC|nr:CAP domain-containing protein [Pseudalkalibacillus decolorationis]
MFKKILVTSLLSASIFGVNAGISEASTPEQQQPQVEVYKQYAQVQIDQDKTQEFIQNCLKQKQNGQLDPATQNKIDELLKKAKAQLQEQKQKEAPQKADEPKQEQSEEKAEQPAPAPEKKAEPAPEKQPEPQKQTEPAPEQKPAPEQAPAPKPAPEQPAEEPAAENESNFALTADEQQMVDLVNQEREKAGLAPLKVDPELTKVARIKAKDMIENNYFSHNSPTYGSPFDMMKQFGVDYNTAGENIAGNGSVEGAHTSLMNSQGHRENILGSQYTEVGIGIVDGGQYGKMFVQMFKG